MFETRKHLKLIAVGIIVAGISLTSPQLARADAGGCQYCRDGCPADLNAFCHSKGCSSAGAACSLEQCHGIDEIWYDNRITCGAEE